MKRLSQIVVLWPVIILCLLSVFAACSGTREAYRAAEGVEEIAKVVGEHYYALIKEANRLSSDGVLYGNSLAKAQDVVRATQPVISELAEAAKAYKALRSAETEAELKTAITNAAIAVSRLINAVKGSNLTGEIWLQETFGVETMVFAFQ